MWFGRCRPRCHVIRSRNPRDNLGLQLRISLHSSCGFHCIYESHNTSNDTIKKCTTCPNVSCSHTQQWDTSDTFFTGILVRNTRVSRIKIHHVNPALHDNFLLVIKSVALNDMENKGQCQFSDKALGEHVPLFSIEALRSSGKS